MTLELGGVQVMSLSLPNGITYFECEVFPLSAYCRLLLSAVFLRVFAHSYLQILFFDPATILCRALCYPGELAMTDSLPSSSMHSQGLAHT
jgi:hypothetical protein